MTPVVTCPRHPLERALAPCKRCSEYVCLNCVKHDEMGEAYCPLCAPNEALPLASLIQRAQGHVVDVFLLCAAAIVGYLLGRSTIGFYVGSMFVVALNLTLLHRQGQSLGKLCTGTRMVTASDQRITLWHVLVRAPIFALGPIDAFFLLSDARRALHDLVASTRVVTEPSSRHLYD